MEHFETDEQRAEALIEWLKANGMVIFLGVVIGLGSVGAYGYWQKQKIVKWQTAGDEYKTFVKTISQQNSNTMDAKIDTKILDESLNRIIQNPASASSEFVTLAKLQAASGLASAKNFDAAIKQYQSLNTEEKDPTLKTLINYRLAHAQFEKGDFTAALTTINSLQESAFNALVFELQGDIYMKQNKTEEAKNAYIQAKNYGNKSIFLRDKMTQLGVDVSALQNIALKDVTNINK